MVCVCLVTKHNHCMYFDTVDSLAVLRALGGQNTGLDLSVVDDIEEVRQDLHSGEQGMDINDWIDEQVHTDDVFFFQAEDGIRDYKVTGVQTCALPIYFILISGYHESGGKEYLYVHDPLGSHGSQPYNRVANNYNLDHGKWTFSYQLKIGRASCRERG